MGEMADFYNEQVEVEEDERFSYRMGEMSDIEAYEKGIIDELGYEHLSHNKSKSKTCRCCKESGLHWAIKDSKYTLFDDNNKIHKCKMNPLNRKKNV